MRFNYLLSAKILRQILIKSAVIILVLLLQTISFSTVRYVSKTGSSTEPYTSWATAADGIQKCINVSFFGDTIYVGDGVYKEIVDMKHGISLIGSGFENCIIDGRSLGIPNAGGFLINAKDSCLISGFNLMVNDRNSPSSGQNYDGYAIFAYSWIYTPQYTVTIRNNLISQAFFGIRVTYRKNVNIYDNIFTNCDYPIRIDINIIPGKFLIKNNIISDVYNTAIYSGASSISAISNNLIYLEGYYARGMEFKGLSMIFKNNIVATDTDASFAIASYDTPGL